MCAAKLEPQGLLMPKATAVWLVENTVLTFEQISGFTGLHAIEVQALADGDIGRGIVGRNPVEHEEIVQEELDKAIKDDSYIMKMAKSNLPKAKIRSKGPKYTPVSKRGDKPDAIAYLVKHHPEVSDAQISKLVGTTKPTINAVRDRSHANASTIKPRHPVDLGLCTYVELEAAIDKGLRAQGKDPEEIRKQKEKMLQPQEQEETTNTSNSDSGFDFSNFTSNVQSGTDQ
jgi:hypothetical protein